MRLITWCFPFWYVQGSLGGFFTSVEGLLQKLRDHLKEGNPFGSGDSAVKHHATGEEASTGQKFRAFMAQLEDLVEGRRFPFTLQLHVSIKRYRTRLWWWMQYLTWLVCCAGMVLRTGPAGQQLHHVARRDARGRLAAQDRGV